MKPSNETLPVETTVKSPEPPQGGTRLPRAFLVAVGALLLAFSWPLYQLVLFGLDEKLYSHIVLIPVISAYLVWMKRNSLPPASEPSRGVALLTGALGAAIISAYGIARASGVSFVLIDSLAYTTLAFLLLFVAACAWFLGGPLTRAIAFPLSFLVFMAPLPVAVFEATEIFLQHGSALAALVFFRLAGTPLFRHELIFELPGISLQVAPECSGIHSTIALLMTSLLAGYLFLRSPWTRTILAIAVIPLALIRNGVRVFTIGELCVHISPDMINSYIHHKGGPIFFALSLIPFFFFLLYLRKYERRHSTSKTSSPVS